ncbi:flap endonuclease Xni [Motiliproteus sp.]|uniref:flap endonuclease Xni n=1 Tax=Motiliproteus sp. TaxID=1898955 RepID=UPI003BAAAC65
MAIKLLLIDAMNLIRRVHAAVPGEGDDAIEAALTTSGQIVGRLLSRFEPTHGVCAFDGWQKSWRHLAYPDYKAGRKPMPDSLRDNLDRFQQLFRYKGLTSLTYPHYEADDVLTTLAAKTLQAGGEVVLVSTDKGFAQLLASDPQGLVLWDHFAKQQIDRDFIQQRFQVQPGQLCDYLALCGDNTNRIRGVDGIGAKGAAQLLAQWPDLEALFAELEQLPTRYRNKLEGRWAQVEQARRLVALRSDLELDCSLKEFRLGAEAAKPMIKNA